MRDFAFLLYTDLEDTSSFEAVERETGRRPTSDVKCTLEIAHASSKAAEDLKVSVGEPLFLETIHFLDQDGKPLMIGRQYIVGSLYIFNI